MTHMVQQRAVNRPVEIYLASYATHEMTTPPQYTVGAGGLIPGGTNMARESMQISRAKPVGHPFLPAERGPPYRCQSSD